MAYNRMDFRPLNNSRGIDYVGACGKSFRSEETATVKELRLAIVSCLPEIASNQCGRHETVGEREVGKTRRTAEAYLWTVERSLACIGTVFSAMTGMTFFPKN